MMNQFHYNLLHLVSSTASPNITRTGNVSQLYSRPFFSKCFQAYNVRCEQLSSIVRHILWMNLELKATTTTIGVLKDISPKIRTERTNPNRVFRVLINPC